MTNRTHQSQTLSSSSVRAPLRVDLSKLGYIEDGHWMPLPKWARFFISLGVFMADMPAASERNWRAVVAVSVPTGFYAATFAATGVVLSSAEVRPVPLNAADHFKELCSLPHDTPVEIVIRGRRLKGILAGCKDQKLVVQVQGMHGRLSRALKHLIGPAESLSVRITDLPITVDDLPADPSGRRVTGAGPLAEAMLGRSVADTLATSSRMDCVVVGRKNRFRQEAQEVQFGFLLRAGGHASGHLQNILRARALVTNQPYRSDIIAARAKRWSSDVETAPVAILDGAASLPAAYRRCGPAHLVVLLDRTEHGFGAAVDAINEYYRSPDRQTLPERLPAWPDGVEVMAFREIFK